MRVGVFDSGVGGLSILAAIHETLPAVDLSYCCDNKNFPYGTKTEAQVLDFAASVTSRFFDAAGLDVLVVACNTASVISLPKIRSNLPIPVVGVVPAVKPAARRSKSKIIGVLATPVTIARPYLNDLIKEFASDCEVIKCGSSELVILAERKLRGDVGTDEEFRREVEPIIAAAARGLDQLVLGCTHFPLVSEELRRVIPPSVTFVDSGAAIASRVASILDDLKLNKTASRSVQSGFTGWCSGLEVALSWTRLGQTLVLHTLP